MSFASVTNLAAVSTVGYTQGGATPFGTAASRAISDSIGRLAGQAASSMRQLDGSLAVVQAADAGAESVEELLGQLRDVAQQATSDSITADERSALEEEFSDLLAELDDVAQSTSFAGKDLLDGTLGTQTLQIGERHAIGSKLQVEFGDLTTSGLGIESLSIDSAANAEDALIALDRATQSVEQTRSGLATASNTLIGAYETAEAQAQALAPAEALSIAEQASDSLINGMALGAQSDALSVYAPWLV